MTDYPWPLFWQDQIEHELGMTLDHAASKLSWIGDRITEMRVEAGLKVEPEPAMPPVAGAFYTEADGWTEPITYDLSTASESAELTVQVPIVGGWVPTPPPTQTLRERVKGLMAR